MNLEFSWIVFLLFILFLLAAAFVAPGHKYLETKGGDGREDHTSWLKGSYKQSLDYFAKGSPLPISGSRTVENTDGFLGFLRPDIVFVNYIDP